MKNSTYCGVTGGFILFILALNASIGGFAVNYLLSLFGKNIPFLLDMVIGFFAGQFAIPLAIIGYLLRLFGIV